jgi:acetyl esterase/lipase
MELIHANAEKWNTDTSRIAILGFSAGGHLACHYTNAYDCPEVREIFADSKPVQASVLCYPVITTKEPYCHKGSFENLTGQQAPFDDRFSCENLVSEKTPPTFVWHTAPDKTVPVFNSLLYAQALSEYKIPYSLHIYPYGGHGLSTVEPEINPNLPAGAEYTKQWLVELELWLKEIFK